MKINHRYKKVIIGVLVSVVISLTAFKLKQQNDGYILNHEKDVQIDQEGSHNGGGKTTAFMFFNNFKGAKVSFRKRILHAGSSIGYHLQTEQEIYYIINGDGELEMNGKLIPVTTGDAILTLPGSSHGLKPKPNGELTVLIVYENN